MRLFCSRHDNHVILLYGQECARRIGTTFTRKEMISCVGLREAAGELVSVTHYLGAINRLQQHGFHLIALIPHTELSANRGTKILFLFNRGKNASASLWAQ